MADINSIMYRIVFPFELCITIDTLDWDQMYQYYKLTIIIVIIEQYMYVHKVKLGIAGTIKYTCSSYKIIKKIYTCNWVLCI